ncbi:MAG: hypothetical protein L0241_14000 [Planctomycetia bacterium]|nr:hypothetical protein [Planctomycetia bacterium]
MFAAVALSLAISPGADPIGPQKYTPTYVPVEAPFGYLYRPSDDVRLAVRLPALQYIPKAGDVVLMSDTNVFWSLLYRFALTGRPGHAGIVVTMPDGQLGVLEAGFDGTQWTRLTRLDYKLNQYPGSIWIRERLVPLTPEQDARLTAFALHAADTPYATWRFIAQGTYLNTRGPIRTRFVGRPQGIRGRYICGELVVESVVYAGLIDPRTARPSATYPQDLFYDRSRNPYVDRHPPLAGGWTPSAQWTPVVGWSVKGKEVPKPPSAWIGDRPANVVYPVYGSPNQPPTPIVIGQVPGELYPVTLVQQRSQRIGLFDRPPLLRRRR